MKPLTILLPSLILLTACVSLSITNPSSMQPDQDLFADETEGSTMSATLTTVDELVIKDLEEGTGSAAQTGQSVTVHYTGTLTDGTKFDSSVDRGQPFTFMLGQGDVIKGWDQGVVGMKAGGKRTLTIPAKLGYGDKGIGEIPPGATLVFEVELISIAQ